MISENKLFEILKEWNMWDRELKTGIERPLYLQELIPFIERKEVIVLKGIRRCGKSTIMRQLMNRLVQQGVKKEQILYVNLEIYNFSNFLQLELLELILKVYSKNINKDKKVYFFIDEIQSMPNWERFIRTKYDLDENIKFIVSGSNASLLSKELSTLLTGRNLTFEIRPLNYLEYKTFTLNPELEEYLLYGGFPEVVLAKDKHHKIRILQQYFEDIIYKDVIQRHKSRNTEKVMNLARYLVQNSGTRFSINKLSTALNMDNKTVENHIIGMLDAFLLMKVNHFSYSLKKRFDKATQPKYYVADNGFFQITSLNFTDDKGKKIENATIIELNSKQKDITYWLDTTEVDFVTRTKAINVTHSINEIPPREFTGLTNFKKKHKNFDLILVTPKPSYEKHEGVNIISFEELCSQK